MTKVSMNSVFANVNHPDWSKYYGEITLSNYSQSALIKSLSYC